MPFCNNCGAEVSETAIFCKACGFKIQAAKPITEKPVSPLAEKSMPSIAGNTTPSVGKSMSTVLLLAILPGLVGVWGIGHFYIGRPLRGIAFLVPGLFLDVVSIAIITVTLGIAAPFIIWLPLIGWGLESWDAYNLAKKNGIK